MDGKGSRGLSSGDERRRHDTFMKNGRKVIHYLRTHIQALLASILVIGLVALLFGVFSQFQAPVISTPPAGETSIGYSTFVAQVRSGNMLAVAIRGSDLQGLLANPLTHTITGQQTGHREYITSCPTAAVVVTNLAHHSISFPDTHPRVHVVSAQ